MRNTLRESEHRQPGELTSSTRRCIKRPWTAAELETLRAIYSDLPTAKVAAALNRPQHSVNNMVFKLRITKSAAYLASPEACRMRRGDPIGKEHRFPKGNVPFNKGLRRPGWSPGRMAATQFKPGQQPHSWRPIGSERVTHDGYLERKVTDTGVTKKDWVGVHNLLWIEVNGQIPANHAVCFRDHDRSHISIENLELLSRAELMRRNSVHNLPPELKEVIRWTGVLNRKIRKRECEKQPIRPAQSSVRDNRSTARPRQANGH